MSSDNLWFLSDEHVDIPIQEVDFLPIDDFYFLSRYFKHYLSSMEKFLEQEAAAIRTCHYDEGELSIIENYLDRLEDYFPDLLRKSLFVAIYTAIDTELIRWCDRAHERMKSKSAPRELEGNFREKAKEYITRVLDIRLPTEWQQIQDYADLRHCLVHAQGHLELYDKKKRKHLKDFIRKQRHLYLPNDEVTLEKGFCEEVIKNSTLFFNKLDDALERKRLISKRE